jgi:hypothetical protein
MSEQALKRELFPHAPVALEARLGAAATAERLVNAFEWHRTPQGYAYWGEVFDHLMALAKQAAAQERYPPGPRSEDQI